MFRGKSVSNLHVVLSSSLIFPSSSSEPWRLTFREFVFELTVETGFDPTRDAAFLDTVLWLSSTLLLKSLVILNEVYVVVVWL